MITEWGQLLEGKHWFTWKYDTEQYSHRHYLLEHGVKEQEQKNTDNIVLNVIKEHLDMELLVKDLDRSHIIGKSNYKSKCRLIIVKFTSYNDRRESFNNKKTIKRYKCFHYQEPNCWKNMTVKKMQGINLVLIMCGQFMEESYIKIVPVQNQNYFRDKW